MPRFWNQSNVKILTFSPDLKNDDKEALTAWVNGWSARVKKKQMDKVTWTLNRKTSARNHFGFQQKDVSLI